MIWAASIGTASAQTLPGEYLDINNHKVRIHCTGTIANDNYEARQEAPIGSGLSTLNTSHIWLGGKVQNILSLSCERYRRDGTSWGPSPFGYYPGQNSNISDFIRVWKLSSSQISYHKEHFADFEYTMPEPIANWPSNTLVDLGYGVDAVPFADLNSDSIYQPELGEYPLIKGDQAILFIFRNNSILGNENMAGGSGLYHNLGVINSRELIVGMAYAFDCAESQAIDNSFFIHYKIFENKSYGVYSVKLGVWADFDIGNPMDDFFGSDVHRQLFYAYNGDNYDEGGYGSQTAAHGICLLKGIDQIADGFDNAHQLNNGWGFSDGVVDNEVLGFNNIIAHHPDSGTATGAPFTGIGYHNYLDGKWNDGTVMTYAGDGYMSSNTQARYIYPNASDPMGLGSGGVGQSAWTEESAGNTPGDRMGIGVIGPFEYPESGIVEFEIAHVFARQNAGQSATEVLMEEVDELRGIYKNGGGDCGISFVLGSEIFEESRETNSTVNVYPIPAHDRINIGGINHATQNKLEIINAQGLVLQRVELLNSGYTTISISALSSGVYFLRVSEMNSSKQQIVKFVKQ